jgi:uncharacterized protein
MSNDKLKVKITGMHCASCEVLIERRFKKVPGVEKVRVRQGEADIVYSQKPSLQQLNHAVEKDGYSVHAYSASTLDRKNTKRDYAEIGALFLVLIAVYFLLKQFSLIPEVGLTDNMSYGFIFIIGLIAATSTCLAVSGGLLLAVAAKYSEAHPNLSGTKKFKPHIFFNIGRIVSYTVFGALLGALGSLFMFSSGVSGIITVVVSIVMIFIGLQMLNLFPAKFSVKMPKFIAHRVYDEITKEYRPSAPFFLGATTFFLPCGFTQALQLYVLTTGDWVTGALTMLVFSLGTAPSLIGLGAVTSFTKGSFHKHFLRFAAVLVILLGVFSLGSGMNLLDSGDSSLPVNAGTGSVAQDPNVQLIDGKQVVNMRIDGFNYYPSQFTVEAGKPVEWNVDASKAAGCGKVLIADKIGVREYIQGTKTIRFTPTQPGTISFTCSMGMMTPGAKFTVVAAVEPACDAALANCVL